MRSSECQQRVDQHCASSKLGSQHSFATTTCPCLQLQLLLQLFIAMGAATNCLRLSHCGTLHPGWTERLQHATVHAMQVDGYILVCTGLQRNPACCGHASISVYPCGARSCMAGPSCLCIFIKARSVADPTSAGISPAAPQQLQQPSLPASTASTRLCQEPACHAAEGDHASSGDQCWFPLIEPQTPGQLGTKRRLGRC